MDKLPSTEQVSAIIRSRSSIFPAMYTDEPISEEVIMDLLENANWAPNHKKTEPWRFKVIRGAALQRLADFMGSTYKSITPQESFSEMKMKKLSTNPIKANTVIAICMQRDPAESLPEWEELAATAMAVQNLWLSATAYGLGGYWSSPGLIAHLGPFLNLAEGERCLGLFYLAHHQAPEIPRERGDVAAKVKWMKE
ncbi:nitroreductase [Lewinella sp. LCG006]|uniref:nitroreductase family protein n=1 Tax=Lewinella sp. LCG006 TaxID=3231911 RepID=UPI003460C7F2